MQPLKTSRIEVQGYIQWIKDSISDEGRYEFMRSEDMSAYGYALVCSHTLAFDLPDSFHPAKAEMAALEARKKALTDEFNARIHEITERIRNLQCLEHYASEVRSDVGIPGMETEA